MKKIINALLIIVSILFFIVSAFAEEGEKPETTLYLIKGKAPIKIDGSLSDWKKLGIKPVVLNTMKQVAIGKPYWLGKEKQSGKIYVAFDNNNLYLAAKVKSPRGLKNNKKGGKIYDGNTIELFIGFDNSEPDRETYAETDYQLGFSVGYYLKKSKKWKIKPSIYCFNLDTPFMKKKVDDKVIKSKIKVKPIKGGYILEAKVPSEFFEGWYVEDGLELGFDVGIDDVGKKGFSRKIQLTWTGDKNGWQYPKGWGRAILKEIEMKKESKK